MSRTVWEIETDVARLMREVEDLVEQDRPVPAELSARLTDLLREERAKADAVGRFLKDLRAAEERCAEEARALAERSDRYRRTRDRVAEVVLLAMGALGRTRIDGDLHSLRKVAGRPHVEVSDPDALAEEYVRVVRSPNKEKIAADVREGKTVLGAHLVDGRDYLRVWT